MMDWLVNCMENIRDMLGMDSNSFYPMLLTVLGILYGIGKFLKNCSKEIKEQRERKMFELYCKSESDNFYCFVMLGELIVLIISFLGCCFFYYIIGGYFGGERQLTFEWVVIISSIISVIVTLLMTKTIWIRKRLLGDKKGKIIILCSIFFVNIAFVCDAFGKYISTVFIIFYIIIEIIGLLHFTGRYKKYDFSSIILHLDNGETIVCEDIEKIVRKKDYISVEVEGRNIILQYNKIWEVEYYGAPKFILKNVRA